MRAFDDAGFMLAADVVDGRELGEALTRLFAADPAAFVDIHYAKPGCFAARALRTDG